MGADARGPGGPQEQELERAHTSLVSSEKMASLGKLAATVAHEVNNPLFGILTYSRLCLKEIEHRALPQDAARKLSERLKLIERESRRCGDIIRNLLTFARQAPQRREPNNAERADRTGARARAASARTAEHRTRKGPGPRNSAHLLRCRAVPAGGAGAVRQRGRSDGSTGGKLMVSTQFDGETTRR